MQLEGQVAVVTGAGTGIGRATAATLARQGAAVVAVARTAANLESIAAEIRAAGGQALAVPTDVAEERRVARLVERTLAEYGQIDILVNNAGTNVRAPIHQIKTEDWRTILDSNATGTFLCTRAVVPYMMERKSGKIINVSSGAGKRGSATRAAYSAAKFGVVGFGQAVQADLKEYGITVSVVLPGPIDTPLRRRNVPGEDPAILIGPETVADVILFLATRPQNVVIPEVAIYPRAFI
ncbi:MAG TPA: SDR family NAD(P)-dependent oxidoreductase [Chloroflexota bacterium]|nr:SDR family NAD(P)-dependent oxidoreductase [Chloroflexota bacterium]